jgi:hypothetical protein
LRWAEKDNPAAEKPHHSYPDEEHAKSSGFRRCTLHGRVEGNPKTGIIQIVGI